MKSRRLIFWLVLLLALAVLQFTTWGFHHDRQGQEPFVTIAEGFTSPSLERGIDVWHRRFSSPDLPGLCAAAPRPATLHHHGPTPVLRVNQWFSLDSLIIAGYDAAGRLLGPLPIVVEAEEQRPPLLDLRSEAISESRLLPIRPGRVRFRIKPLCPAGSATLMITTEVDHR